MRALGTLRFPFALSLITLGAASACADLPAIVTNTCGNKIVDSGEDCDTFAASGSSCRAPGSAGACRYDCAGTNLCPPSYSCGAVDKICRQASGAFDVTSSQTAFAQANFLTFDDFDGDGRDDAITTGVNDVRVHYFDNGFTLAKTVILPLPGARLHPGIIGNDTNVDLENLRASGTMDVFRGQSDRSFSPVIYSAIPIPNTRVTARTFLVRNQVTNTTGDSLSRPTGNDVLAFGSRDTGNGGVVVDLAARSALAQVTTDSIVAIPDSTVDKMVGAVAIGSFIEGSVCDQFAIGFSGSNKVSVYSPCRHTTPIGNGKTYEINNALDAGGHIVGNYLTATAVTLPLGVNVGITSAGSTAGAFAVDANGDGHQDLVIAATLASSPQIYVAYGIGDGTFSSSSTLLPVDNSASIYTAISAVFAQANNKPVPLAVADLNDDGLPDFVFPSGIEFSEVGATPAANHYVAGPTAGVTLWTGAVIADLNRDGIPDVAAANPDGAIDLFVGTGNAAMSFMSYGLEGPPANLVAGDFDGDLVNDVAFSVSGAVTDDGGAAANDLEVLFGQGLAFPAQPTSLGSLSNIVQMTSGPLTSTYTGATASTNASVSSMVALSVDASSNVFAAVLLGNPDRLITSSFALYVSATQRASAIRVTSGPIVSTAENDFLFLAQDASDATKYELWLAPSTGEATLDATKLETGNELPTTLDWTLSTLTETTLATSGVASPIVLVPPVLTPGADPASAGSAHMFVIDPATLSLGPAVSLSCTYASSSSLQLRSADFDGDGFRDIATYCSDVSGKSVMTVYWGNGTPTLDAARSSTLSVPAEPVTGFAIYRNGPVVPRSLGVLTASAFYTTTPGGSDHRTFGPLMKDPSLPGGGSMGSADIDGDGVADLGIVDTGKTRTQFFRGLPVNDAVITP